MQISPSPGFKDHRQSCLLHSFLALLHPLASEQTSKKEAACAQVLREARNSVDKWLFKADRLYQLAFVKWAVGRWLVICFLSSSTPLKAGWVSPFLDQRQAEFLRNSDQLFCFTYQPAMQMSYANDLPSCSPVYSALSDSSSWLPHDLLFAERTSRERVGDRGHHGRQCGEESVNKHIYTHSYT